MALSSKKLYIRNASGTTAHDMYTTTGETGSSSYVGTGDGTSICYVGTTTTSTGSPGRIYQDGATRFFKLNGNPITLTKIEVDIKEGARYGGNNGVPSSYCQMAVENEIDADGGARVSNYGTSNYVDIGSWTIPVSGSPTADTFTFIFDKDASGNNLSIPWANRYNYRLGSRNVYMVDNIRLYADGSSVATETQSALAQSLVSDLFGAGGGGVNLDPSNRNRTTFGLGADGSYPK